jgi:hypothetical protein
VATIVPLVAAFGGYAWFRMQMYYGWSTKAVLVINLIFLSWIPLWGCVGFFSDTVGGALRNPVVRRLPSLLCIFLRRNCISSL